MLYNNLSGYFRNKYGKRLKKICVDGGFSCPNRDGTVGVGGCIFCSERGSGEHIKPCLGIREQVERALSAFSKEDGFAVYFQNFTNTYAPLDVLRERYESAIIDERIKLLIIGTRPDCITEKIASLIASYKERLDVWVELGLQTASDKTARLINRGYDSEVFERAIDILSRYGIPVVVHLIVGLPGEGLDEIKKTVEYINRFPIFGLKIHSLYVVLGTRLFEMYESGEYEPPTLNEYIEGAVYILTHVSPDTVIHRLTGDAPKDMLIAPKWSRDKHAVIQKIVSFMEKRGLKQGSFFKENG